VLIDYYEKNHPEWTKGIQKDYLTMREGIDTLRHQINAQEVAYSYSSRRGWIPFGWFSHAPEVLSLASTGWVILVDCHFNPFYLAGVVEDGN